MKSDDDNDNDIDLDDERTHVIDVHDLKPDVVRRLLREAWGRESRRSLMVHTRKSAASKGKEQDEATEDADDENEKLVALSQSRGKPTPIPVAESDYSEETTDSLKAGIKKAKKPSKA